MGAFISIYLGTLTNTTTIIIITAITTHTRNHTMTMAGATTATIITTITMERMIIPTHMGIRTSTGTTILTCRPAPTALRLPGAP